MGSVMTLRTTMMVDEIENKNNKYRCFNDFKEAAGTLPAVYHRPVCRQLCGLCRPGITGLGISIDSVERFGRCQL
ncbi:MAG: hypothetical protein ACI831_001530, partial [Candidatus Azotimanducaceae bacterium]